FVRGAALGGGRTLHAMGRYLVDGGGGGGRPGLGVNGIAWLTPDIPPRPSNFSGKGGAGGAGHPTAFAFDNLSYVFRAVQNGLVQHYALSMLIGVFLLIFAGRFLLGLY